MCRGMIFWLSVLATACSLAGNLLVNSKKRVGFIIWIISNVLWVIINFRGEMNTMQVIMFIAYSVLNIIGWLQWGRSKDAKKT